MIHLGSHLVSSGCDSFEENKKVNFSYFMCWFSWLICWGLVMLTYTTQDISSFCLSNSLKDSVNQSKNLEIFHLSSKKNVQFIISLTITIGLLNPHFCYLHCVMQWKMMPNSSTEDINWNHEALWQQWNHQRQGKKVIYIMYC